MAVAVPQDDPMPNGSPYAAHDGRRLHGNLGLANRSAIVLEPGHMGGETSDGRTSGVTHVFRLEQQGDGSIDTMLMRPLMRA